MAKRGPKAMQTADNPLSRFLRQWLDAHELSREKAAKRWGVSQGTLRNLEAGVDLATGRSYKPKVQTLRQLAAGMEVPLETLMALQVEDAEPPSVVRQAPDEPATLGGLAELLDTKMLGLYGGHLALSREALAEVAAAFRQVEAHLLALRRVHKDGLGPEERDRLERQAEALRHHLARTLHPLESYTDGLQALLPAIQGRADAEVERLSRELLGRIKAELVMQVKWDDARASEVRETAAPAPAPGPVLEAMNTDEGRLVPLRGGDRRLGRPIDITGRISAGPGYYTDDEFAEETIEEGDATGADYAMRVSGDSLQEAGIIDGDILYLVHTSEARPGDLVAVWSAQKGRTVKYFHLEGGKPVLVPANPKYPKIPFTQDFHIKARVIRVRRDVGRR